VAFERHATSFSFASKPTTALGLEPDAWTSRIIDLSTVSLAGPSHPCLASDLAIRTIGTSTVTCISTQLD
jgi:hypothetical protein